MGPLLVFFWCPGRTELSALRPAHQWIFCTKSPLYIHAHKQQKYMRSTLQYIFFSVVCFYSVDTPKLVSDHQKCAIRQAERASLSPDV